MEDRDWWNHGINPITGYKVEVRRDTYLDEKKYHMQSVSFGNKIKSQ